MRLDGIHHITAITGDAQRNLDFYVGLLGLRFVKKTINFDAPDVYHLYYGDEIGDPGSVLTFFEFRGTPPGRAGTGMIHRIAWRVEALPTLDFWEQRLSDEGADVRREGDRLLFADPEGLELELVVDTTGDEALVASSDEIPAQHTLRGFDGVRAYSDAPAASDTILTRALRFAARGDGLYECRGDARGAFYALDPSPGPGGQGAGTVHHIAWAAEPEHHGKWRERIVEADTDVTPIIDRVYFRSVYFREPSGVLFEIATIGPGFAVDEPLENLGRDLMLPQWYESMRSELEGKLTPLREPTPARAFRSG